MANTNSPRGLIPCISTASYLKAKLYKIAAAYAQALYIGDPVARNSSGDIIIATAGAGSYVLGAAIGFYDVDKGVMSTNYYVSATAGVHYALVTDDPDQEYIIQEDSDGGSLALTDLAAGVNLVAGTGSTTTGLSAWQADSSSAGTGATVQLRLIDLVQAPDNAIGTNAKWRVKINYHQGVQATAGTAV